MNKDPQVNFSDRFIRQLNNISENSNLIPNFESHHRVYILEVKSNLELEGFNFYVGQTKDSIENRVKTHLRAGLFSWSQFRNGNYDLVRVRKDLHSQFPTFGNEVAAKKAEGLVADYLNALGFMTDSDQTKPKREKRISQKGGKYE